MRFLRTRTQHRGTRTRFDTRKDVESLMIESRFCRHDPFEYEYRCTEYEYDSSAVLVLDYLLSYGLGSFALDRSSQHRENPD